MLSVWQRNIVDRFGNVVPNATVEVRDTVTGELSEIYSDSEGTTTLDNPFTADASGFAKFYARGGLYNITVHAGGAPFTWDAVSLGALSHKDEITADVITDDADELAAIRSKLDVAAAEDVLTKDNNLSDLSSALIARQNLGLGTAATYDVSAFDEAGSAALVADSLADLEASLGELSVKDTVSEAIGDADAVNVNARLGVFNSVADVEGRNIPPVLDAIRTNGYYTPGDGGGALYKRVASEPGHAGKIQSADGAWWELASIPINVRMFGARGDGTSDDTSAIRAAITSHLREGGVHVPPGVYIISSLLETGGSVRIYGRKGLSVFRLASGYGGPILMTSGAPDGTRLKDCVMDGITFEGNGDEPVRWLSRLDGTPITDPEADYVAGTGALASGITGVELEAVVSDGAITGVNIISGGEGWNGHPTHPYQPNTVPLKFTGDGVGGAGYATISGGTLTSVTITDPGEGYTSAPAVETMGGYADISWLTTPGVDRRNPNYATGVTYLLRWRYTENSVIRNCIFRNHVRGIEEAGGKNVLIEGNVFESVGKNDGPYAAIWSQSFGTPGAGQSFYRDSENIVIRNNVARGLERCFAIFQPTKGGKVYDNVVEGWGEACIFIGGNGNYYGDTKIEIHNNRFENGTLTDIACEGVEVDGVPNVSIKGNTISSPGLAFLKLTGMDYGLVAENKLTDPYRATEYPYGPFSERYGYNVGSRPICGTKLAGSSALRAGSIGSKEGKYLIIERNHVVYAGDRRVEFLLSAEKSGSDSIAGPIILRDNIVESPSPLGLINRRNPNVWKSSIPIHTSGNIGTLAEAPISQRITFERGEIGVKNVRVGFRPSRIYVMYTRNNAHDGDGGWGEIVWTPSGYAANITVSHAKSEGGQYLRLENDEVARTVNDAGERQWGVEFYRWLEDGFALNVVAAPSTGSHLIMQVFCYP